MLKSRNIVFVLTYSFIVVSMLFMFLYVQRQYAQNPSGPYRKKFIDKFFEPDNSGSVLPIKLYRGEAEGKNTLIS
jgi:hypothetical protein